MSAENIYREREKSEIRGQVVSARQEILRRISAYCDYNSADKAYMEAKERVENSSVCFRHEPYTIKFKRRSREGIPKVTVTLTDTELFLGELQINGDRIEYWGLEYDHIVSIHKVHEEIIGFINKRAELYKTRHDSLKRYNQVQKETEKWRRSTQNLVPYIYLFESSVAVEKGENILVGEVSDIGRSPHGSLMVLMSSTTGDVWVDGKSNFKIREKGKFTRADYMSYRAIRNHDNRILENRNTLPDAHWFD